MFRGLYDCFCHWYRGGNIWLYSDPHFADDEMKYIRKNYVGDDEQVRRINSKVGKKDTIIFLGDIGDQDFMRDIRGYKVLVMGNHDKGVKNYIECFDEVYEGPIMINNKIMLSHERVDLPFIYSIHGHNHSDIMPKTASHLNVCAELIDYTPISLLTVLKEGWASKVDDIHRQTIDKAKEKSQDRENGND